MSGAVKLNAGWHAAHRLPRNASLEERLQWHVQHAENCQCRSMPDAIRRELVSRGWVPPQVQIPE